MNLSDQELASLNSYLNSTADLPVEIEAINVRLRDFFQQDNTVIAPEVEAAIEDDAAEAAPADDSEAEAAPREETAPEDQGDAAA